MHMWLKNTDGKRDAVLTMTFMGFVIVVVKFLLTGVSIALDESRSISFGSVDGAMIAAVLTPTLGAYCARRYTDKKLVGEAQPSEPSDEG